MIATTNKRIYSFKEYLEIEETADYKHEYQDGEIVSMTGGTTEHNKIAFNFASYLKFALKRKKQKKNIFIGDVKLWIPEYNQATYPDVIVIDNEPIYYGTGKTTVTITSQRASVASAVIRIEEHGQKSAFSKKY